MQNLLIILSRPEYQNWATELIHTANPAQSHILVASPAEAAQQLIATPLRITHIVLDIGQRGSDVLAEIDQLAQQCETGTRVVAVGDTNDVQLYRGLISRGVDDYLPMPAAIADVLKALNKPIAPTNSAAPRINNSANKRVIVFMSAASSDGASTAALNSAYAISQIQNGNTVLVDMDYQFGMVAKQLGLQNQYGIRDLFDHPDRGVDATLIQHMVASYGKLHVITAPAELRYMPTVSAEAIHQLIATLKQNYDTVIIDLPHAWFPWISAVMEHSTHLVLVAQLWLKSVSHAARIIRALREHGVAASRIIAVINRRGAKFQEAIDPKDFERVCNIPIRHTMSNDIQAIVAAEAEATTIMQLQPSALSHDINNLARSLLGLAAQPEDDTPVKRPRFFFKR